MTEVTERGRVVSYNSLQPNIGRNMYKKSTWNAEKLDYQTSNIVVYGTIFDVDFDVSMFNSMFVVSRYIVSQERSVYSSQHYNSISCSLSRPKEPATGPYPEAVATIPYHYTIFLSINFLSTPVSPRQSLPFTSSN